MSLDIDFSATGRVPPGIETPEAEAVIPRPFGMKIGGVRRRKAMSGAGP